MSLKSLLIFVLVAILSASIAKAQSLVGIVHVNGTLYCSSNGNSSSGNATPVFPNATLEVRCTANVIADIPSNATTNASGAYLVILIPRPNTTVASITSNCRLFVVTPISTCNPALPSVGLVSNLRFVRTIFVGFLRLTYLVADGFTLQA